MSEEQEGKVKISLRSVIEDLGNGVTRCKGDAGYDATLGSIQEKYDLNKTQVKELFKHDQLKGRRVHVKVVPAFELIDDLEEGEVITNSRYGEQSASSLNNVQTTLVEEQDGNDIPNEMI